MAKFFADRVAIGSQRAQTPEGYLICLGVPIARTGWQTYREGEIDAESGGEGEIEVYRDEKEVFSPETIASFEGKTVTTPHPPTFLTPHNDNAFSKGHGQNVRKGPQLPDGEYALLADLVIKDSYLIQQINSDELREVSCGYECVYEPINGKGSRYAQTKIRGNHIAIVPTGRAGENIRIYDSAAPEEEVSVSEPKYSLKQILSALLGKDDAKVLDSDPGAVERNEQKNELAEERSDVRNADEVKPENAGDDRRATNEDDRRRSRDNETPQPQPKEKPVEEPKKPVEMSEDAGAKCPECGRPMPEEAKDTEEQEEAGSAEKTEFGESEPPSEEVGDSDLIPVETLKGEEVPKNPIPGADAALAHLRAIRKVVAASKDRKVIDEYNNAVRRLKGKPVRPSKDGYTKLVSRSKPEEVRTAETQPRTANDAREQSSADFVAMAKKFHRQSPNLVNLKEGGK